VTGSGPHPDPTTQRVRIDLAYDGSPFRGFARQPDQRTVQGALEGALSRLANQPVVTTVAGRTDAGVHALGQVVHVDVDPGVPAARRLLARLDSDPESVRSRLDTMVGDAITIWRVRSVPDAFDARFSAVERRYRYVLVDTATMDPRRRTTVWHVGTPLRLRPMQRAARHLLGEHDFASFCRANGRHTRRRIDAISVSRPAAGEIHVRLRGPAFCHQQVRSITGCLVAVGAGDHEPGWVAEVLAARDRAAAARVAPPQGLTLEVVSYGRRWPAGPPPAARRPEP
jgi:tRNA pseudouridine38-40 synthase